MFFENNDFFATNEFILDLKNIISIQFFTTNLVNISVRYMEKI